MKTLAVLLCICLMAPSGKASESSDRPTADAALELVRDAAGTEGAASAAVSQAPDSPEAFGEEELAELSERAEEPGEKVVGGALSNEHLTYIVIALAAAVIVLIAK